MSVKRFLENFWESEQKNVLFVCMPLKDSSKKFKKIKQAAKSVGFEHAINSSSFSHGDSISHMILDGVANSKMLLFDLSDDPKSKCKFSKQINENVLYELGIAVTIREPEDMVLIRSENSTSEIPFDIKDLKRNVYTDLTADWLQKILKPNLDNQKWFLSKRVRKAADSIDPKSYEIMLYYGRIPLDYFDNFAYVPVEEEHSLYRLMDLGIIRFNSLLVKNKYEYSYHWTPFGYEVMKHLKINKFTEEEAKGEYTLPNFLNNRKKQK